MKRRSGRIGQRADTTSNAIGEFRLAPIVPGDYVLSATSVTEPFARGPLSGSEGGLVVYPGGMSLDQAQPLVVQEGQSVSDIELELFPLAPSKVTGHIVGPDGERASNAVLYVGPVVAGDDRAHTLLGSSVRDGAFELTLMPGLYDLNAESYESSPGQVGFSRARRPVTKGTTRMTVTGDALEGVVVRLVALRRVTGRLVFDGTGLLPPPEATAVRLYAAAGHGACEYNEGLVNPDFTFAITVSGDRCQIGAGVQSPGWYQRSVARGADDVTFAGVAVQDPRPLTDLVITFTDRTTKLTAEVTTVKGERAEEFVVVVFPAERSQRPTPFWGHPGLNHRMVRRIGPSLAGNASTEGLVAGDYLIVAIDPDDVDSSGDPEFFERLEPFAQRITLNDGDVRAIPLRIEKLPDAP